MSNFSHPNKPRRWIIARYFSMFKPARQDKWVLGSRETGFYLRKFAWTKIVRHRMVAGRASPDDPPSPGTGSSGDAATASRSIPRPGTCCAASAGRCPLCRGLLLHADRQPQSPEEWQQWHTVTRKAVRKRTPEPQRCRRTHRLLARHPRSKVSATSALTLVGDLRQSRCAMGSISSLEGTGACYKQQV